MEDYSNLCRYLKFKFIIADFLLPLTLALVSQLYCKHSEQFSLVDFANIMAVSVLSFDHPISDTYPKHAISATYFHLKSSLNLQFIDLQEALN